MKLITCQRCGKQELRHANARFCLDCANERYRTWYKHKRDWKLVKKKCGYCGKKFTRSKPNQNYCSDDCAAAANRINARLAYALRRKCAKK